MRALASLCALLVSGCRADAAWDGTYYACESGECPAGYVCGADERCVPVTNGAPNDGAGTDAPAVRVPDGSAPTADARPAVTATFGERPDATFQGVTADTFLDEGAPANNHGVHDDVHLAYGDSDQISLLRFDLSALPAGATVLSAELRVWTDDDAEAPLDMGSSVVVYRVLEAWEEGTGEFEAGAANWADRQAGVAWASAGCGAPGSRDDTILGEMPVGTTWAEYVVAIPATTVQGWVSDPSSNHGFALHARGSDASDYGWLVSREFATVEMRPLLAVVYRTP